MDGRKEKTIEPTPGEYKSIERNRTKGFCADDPLILTFSDTTRPCLMRHMHDMKKMVKNQAHSWKIAAGWNALAFIESMQYLPVYRMRL